MLCHKSIIIKTLVSHIAQLAIMIRHIIISLYSLSHMYAVMFSQHMNFCIASKHNSFDVSVNLTVMTTPMFVYLFHMMFNSSAVIQCTS